MSIEKSSFDEFAESEQEKVIPDIPQTPAEMAEEGYRQAKLAWHKAVADQDIQIAAIRAGVALKRLAMDNARQLLESFSQPKPRGRPRKVNAVPPLPDESLDVS